MTYKVEEVGKKGEITISEEMRRKLGVAPGWRAYQFLEEDHIIIYFRPPKEDDPLAGSLAKYVNESNRIDDDDWPRIKEEAWIKAIEEDHYKW